MKYHSWLLSEYHNFISNIIPLIALIESRVLFKRRVVSRHSCIIIIAAYDIVAAEQTAVT